MKIIEMLGNNSLSNRGKMCSSHPLIVTNKKNTGAKCKWMSHYVFIEHSPMDSFSEGRLVLIYKEKKQCLWPLTLITFTFTIILAFILGFSVGVVILFYLPSKHISHVFHSKDVSDTTNHSLEYKTVSSVTDILPTNNQNRLVNGIYFNTFVEKALPIGFGDEDDRRWNEFVKRSVIVQIEEGCGRMQNRLVTFKDGTKACCRYRQNTDQIQGEIFSYYLGRHLKLNKLVPSTLAVINSSDPQWSSVTSQLVLSQWEEGHPVVLTKFIEHLLPAQIIPSLRHFTDEVLKVGDLFATSTSENSMPGNFSKEERSEKKKNIADWIKSEEEMVEIAQWSDLIIFDYLTANLDRIVNNLYNLQWNIDMLSSPAHNLARVETSGLLVFLDNESGLLHGYRLLHKYEPYHSLLLDGLCVFRKSTVEALTALNLHRQWSSLLTPQLSVLPPLPDRNVDILNDRVARVLRQVVYCSQTHNQAS